MHAHLKHASSGNVETFTTSESTNAIAHWTTHSEARCPFSPATASQSEHHWIVATCTICNFCFVGEACKLGPSEGTDATITTMSYALSADLVLQLWPI
eukprot:4492219-Amphidinium_carterae.1